MARRGRGGRFVKAARSAGRRARRAGGRARSVGRRFARRMRGHSLGLAGKAGVGIVVTAPLIGSGLDSFQNAMAYLKKGATMTSTAGVAFWQFLNGVTKGFGLGDLITQIPVTGQDGSYQLANVQSNIPSGTWWKTTTAGSVLVGFDIAVAWGARKLAGIRSGVRLMWTKLTGGK